MNLPFVDPYDCSHEVEQLVSDSREPAGDWMRRTIVFRCGICGALVEEQRYEPREPGTYTGPNKKLGDYYVREVERVGTEHRQVVRFEVVGTGRVEQMPRSRYDRMVRPG
jgi:hypothetical protein